MVKAEQNPIAIRPDTRIGAADAENDEYFLAACFVDHPALAVVQDINNSKMILTGRTGSGKTAIINKLGASNNNTSTLNLVDFSLNYITNCDVIKFLDSLDIDLDIFFQTLWKHILCIEYIRLRYNVSNEEKSKNIFQNFSNSFSTDRKRVKAIEYLRKWESRFWITVDENVKEITEELESKINAELGSEIKKFTAKAGYSRTIGTEKKIHVVSRAKKVVNSDQLAQLGHVLELLSEYDTHKASGSFFILIDRLDDKWVDESIRFKMIRALIETLRTFRKIRSLKIVVSLRTDVIERVMQDNSDAGFQREKYDDYFVNIEWSKELLWSLIEKRISYLYRKKYTKDNVHFNDIFRHKIKHKEPFDYILERTLYRPRDIISFCNNCLEASEGKIEIRPRNIENAELKYSIIRRQALVEEWQSCIPSLDVALNFLSKCPERFKASDISTRLFIDDFVLQMHDTVGDNIDPIYAIAKPYLEQQSAGSIKIIEIAQHLLATLYRVGVIGIKLSQENSYLYSHRDAPIISPKQIPLESKVHIHWMFHRSLIVL